jgi:amino acid transporter
MKKAVLPLIVLLAFTAYTAFSMSQAEQSLTDFGIELMSSLDTAQVVIDLYILATLACVWMYQDNKSRKKPFIAIVPYIAITAVFVSIGPLLYLVVKGFSKEQ